jgi:hypothetical protein
VLVIVTRVQNHVVEVVIDVVVVVNDAVVEFHLVVVTVVEFHLVVVSVVEFHLITVVIGTTVVVVLLVMLATFSAIEVVCTGEKRSTVVVPAVG